MIVEHRSRGRVATLFRTEGFEVETVGSIDEVEHMIAAFAPEVVVVEWTSVDDRALALCEAIVPATTAPLVLLCEQGNEGEVMAGYAAGAASVLADSTGPRELVARVRAVLRRTGAGADPSRKTVRVDELEVDPAKHEVRLRGVDLVCTPTELRLLHHLVRNRGRVFTRAQLLDKAVGTDVVVIDRNIDVHVATLRKKLADYGSRIVTIRGVGYKFSER